MSYYMRFIVTGGEINLPILDKALNAIAKEYRLFLEENMSSESTDLIYGSERYAELEINRPGDGLFEEEIMELKVAVKESTSGNRSQVLDMLSRATAILAVRVLWQGRETEATLEKIRA